MAITPGSRYFGLGSDSFRNSQNRKANVTKNVATKL